jgi:Bacterial protein of unknown function (DUF924)
MLREQFEVVLRFWFPPHLRDDHAVMAGQFRWWFGGGADSAIAGRFPALLEKATRGELDHSECARISARADHRPRPVLPIAPSGHGAGVCPGSEGSRSGASRPRQRSLRSPRDPVGEDLFLFASGALRAARAPGEGGRARRGLVEQASPELRKVLEHSASQARGHRDVIARFGRHPHRNAVLGRQSTSEELDYLAGGQLVHMRPPPE